MSGDDHEDKLALRMILDSVTRTEIKLDKIDDRVKKLEDDKVYQGGILAGGKMMYTLGAALAGALLTVGALVVPKVMSSMSVPNAMALPQEAPAPRGPTAP